MSVSTAEWLANFGVAGIVLVLMVTGILVPGFIYREKERENELQRKHIEVLEARNASLESVAMVGAKALEAVREVAQQNREERRTTGPQEAVKP